MALEGRDRITSLYHAALERAPGDRAAFLRGACDGDEALRLEVESLLQHATASAAFLETPADAALLPDSSTAMVGRVFGPYQITSLLGAGGMGEVYRARDSKLGRDVAIKILPQAFTADPERRARFAREARVLATLHHPHIAAIYGLEEVGDRSALVLELVEGPTLADRLERGPLSLADALSIARQLVAALDAAHLKGIIHRDLKPANIVLEGSPTTAPGDSRVKVLDFGIAKTISIGEVDPTLLTPATLDGTKDGRILGTPAYMSPEQARGQPVDKRTDIWAFGCVVFEMLTGRRAFEGEGVTDTLARILEREADWAALPANTPASLRALLQRCLQKDPQKRLRDIADARLEFDGGGTHESSFDPRRRRGRLVWISAAFLAGALAAGLLAGGLVLWPLRTTVAASDSLEFAIGPPQGTAFPFQNFGFAIAPDGRHLTMVAFADNWLALWVRPLGSDEPRRLRDTEQANNPFWSPDSRQIAFFAGGKLKTVGLSGEAPFEVCDATPGEGGTGGTWNRGGVILMGSSAGPVMRVSSTGGTPTPVTALKDAETSHRWPWFLPDGEHFLFLAMGRGPNQLRVGSLTSTDSTPVGTIRSNAAYSANHLLFVQGGLMAQPFEPALATTDGRTVSAQRPDDAHELARRVFGVRNGTARVQRPPTENRGAADMDGPSW